MKEPTEDPEPFENENEGVGDESKYDDKAVEYIEFDPAQFELPEDFEVTNNDD